MILKGTNAYFSLPGVETVSPRDSFQAKAPSRNSTIRRALTEVMDALQCGEAEAARMDSAPRRGSVRIKKNQSTGSPTTENLQPVLKMVFHDEEESDDVFQLSYDAEVRCLVAKNVIPGHILPAELKAATRNK